MRCLYSFFILLYNLALHIVSPFNVKAKLMLKGRGQTFNLLKDKISSKDKVAWFHASSLGEFEQGRALMEEFRKKYPNHKIVLSFFSPSGYEIRKNYEGADVIVYLPSDSISNAKRFVQVVRPEYVFFIKYEFWYNFISQAKRKGAKIYQVSLILRKEQYFFKRWGYWFRKQLSNFDYFFVQNEQTRALLSSIGFVNCDICGDTRFDRVAQIAKETKEFNIIKDFSQDNKTILMGSSWDKDEELMAKIIDKISTPFKLIIAPHQINKSHIENILSLFPNATRYTQIIDSKVNIHQSNILIIDCIGILSSLYKYVDIAYIGGGFGVGIHNILEAATYGKPICFGPKYHKFQEAKDLIEREGAFEIRNAQELLTTVNNLFDNDDLYMSSSKACLNYVLENVGACQRIMNKVQ